MGWSRVTDREGGQPTREDGSDRLEERLPTGDVEQRGELTRHRRRGGVLDGRGRPHHEREPVVAVSCSHA